MIKKYASSLVNGMIAQAESLKGMESKLLKGILRELFLTKILNHFLPNQFSVCSGIIINSQGVQSNQIDIIIFDNRVLLPFIYEQNIGVIPAESVLAVIEVKSRIDKKALIETENKAKALNEKVYKEIESKPIICLFGYYGTGVIELRKNEKGRMWLKNNITHIIAICLANRFSWIHMKNGWAMKEGDSIHHEETKRFIAILLDNCRTESEKRWKQNGLYHKDWLGKYIRIQ